MGKLLSDVGRLLGQQRSFGSKGASLVEKLLDG